jgi:hypothetical protein
VDEELERMWKWSWPNLRHYHGIYLEGLRETTKTLKQDRLSPGTDLKPEPSEYETGVLTTPQRRSVIYSHK